MRKSFTLIELLVVIGIVVILSIGTIIGVSTARTKKSSKATVERLRSYLMDVRSLAMMPSTDDLNTGYLQVRIYPWNSSTVKKNVVEVYKIDPKTNVIYELTPVSQYKLPDGYIIDADRNSNLVCFPANSCQVGDPQYYYFNIDAMNSQTIGDIVASTPGKPEVIIQMTEVGNEDWTKDFYAIKMNLNGNVAYCYAKNISGTSTCY